MIIVIIIVIILVIVYFMQNNMRSKSLIGISGDNMVYGNENENMNEDLVHKDMNEDLVHDDMNADYAKNLSMKWHKFFLGLTYFWLVVNPISNLSNIVISADMLEMSITDYIMTLYGTFDLVCLIVNFFLIYKINRCIKDKKIEAQKWLKKFIIYIILVWIIIFTIAYYNGGTISEALIGNAIGNIAIISLICGSTIQYIEKRKGYFYK